jgi:hypothetical protein
MFTEWGLGHNFEFRGEHIRFLWNIFRWLLPKEFISSKLAKQVSNTSDILCPIILSDLEVMRNEVTELKKQNDNLSLALSTNFSNIGSELKGSSQMIAKTHRIVQELPTGEEATSKIGYWLRAVDVIVNLVLMIAAFSLGLLLKDKLLPASSLALSIIIFLAALAAFSLKVFAIPIIHKKKK